MLEENVIGELIVSPETLNIATGIEGLIRIGGSITREGLAQAFDPTRFDIPPEISIEPDSASFLKTSGSTGHCFVKGLREIPATQPFELAGQAMQLGSTYQFGIGVRDNLGRDSVIGISLYPPWTDPLYAVFLEGIRVVADLPTAQLTRIIVRSDGQRISFFRFQGGVYYNAFDYIIPQDVSYFKFLYSFWEQGSKVGFTHTRIDTKIIPHTTADLNLVVTPSANSETRLVNALDFGIKCLDTEQRIVTVSHPLITDSKFVTVNVAALYIRPVDSECGGYAIAGQIYQFETNGGTGGMFEATGGAVLSDLQWQAPLTSEVVNFSYTVGDVVATCQLTVVTKLSVVDVDEDGDYRDLIQGERVRIYASSQEITFSSPNYPHLVSNFILQDDINPSSAIIVAPTDADDEMFGEKNIIVVAEGLGQRFEFYIRVQPMFPTPLFCGAEPRKWLPHVPDYLENRLEMDGGTTEVHNRNFQGILLWDVTYELLRQEVFADCDCEEGMGNSFRGHTCKSRFATAGRLDAFYRLVQGGVQKFSVVDYHTESVYKDIRFTAFRRNHNIYDDQQIRELSFRWEGGIIYRLDELNIIQPPSEIPTIPADFDECFWEIIEW